MIGTLQNNCQAAFIEAVLDLIDVLFLGWTSLPTTCPHRYTQYFQSNCSKTPQSNASHNPGLLNLFKQHYIPTNRIFRSSLPRLPTVNYCPLPSSKHIEGRKPQKHFSARAKLT
jgi:hypothetical protein